MRRLSTHEASFLHTGGPGGGAHVTQVYVYDQSGAPGGRLRFKTLLQHIESRLARLPALRRRLQRPPLDLGHPHWVDDAHFDLEHHVRHVALPQPADWRQFCIQAARMHARPLDLQRPLWEIDVVEGLDRLEGLPPGSFALLVKTHLALTGGEDGGGEITALLHDPTARPPKPPPPAPWFPAPPRLAPLLARAAGQALRAPLTLAAPLRRAWRHAAPAALELAGRWTTSASGLPMTRFNAIVSPHRVFESCGFARDRFEALRTLVPGASVDDVALAVCGGALRRYLARHGELPAASLWAATPLRRPDDGGRLAAARGHAASRPWWTRIELGTDRADPVERLAHVQAQTSSPALRALRGRGGLEGGAGGLAAPGAPAAHCTVTRLPGPAQPLYLCGARLRHRSALMPVADGLGLAFAITADEDRIVIACTACRELMPDPAVFAQGLRDSVGELLALTREAPPAAAARPVRAARPERAAATAVAAAAAARPARAAKAAKAAKAAGPRASPSGRRSPTRPRG